MAEEKGHKPKSGGGSSHALPENSDPFIGIIIFVLLITAVSPFVMIENVRQFEGLQFLVDLYFSILPVLAIISAMVSGLLILGTLYSATQLNHLKSEMKAEVYSKESVQALLGRKNEKWERVLKHIDSENPGDWRLAVLEADVMLEEMVDKMGVPGETLGEKLKNIEKSDFNTIDFAWEAHKVRNMIAHQGSDFMLSQREARKVIRLYQAVFEEFHYI